MYVCTYVRKYVRVCMYICMYAVADLRGVAKFCDI